MKKVTVTIAALAITFAGLAQDKYVSSALTARNQKNYEEAKTAIDKAMENPETKDKPKALFAKALIYTDLAQMEQYKSQKPYKGAGQALIKLAEIKPDFEKDDVNALLFFAAQNYYNDGVMAYYNDKNVSEANEDLRQAMKIYDLGGGKRFEKFSGKKRFDTMAANVDLTLGRIANAQHDSLETIKVMTKVVHNPITKTKDNYYPLLQAYADYNTASGNKMATEELAALQEARTAFPDDANMRNFEINSFQRNGKLKELVSKMEETAQAEPNNSDILFNLALLYQGLATPKDGTKPANKAELIGKSEAAYQKALKTAPESASYNFSFGSLYFNEAYDYNEQMGAITGSSGEDLKKVDALKAKRDGMFEKALPLMEKAYSVLSAKEANLKGNDAEMYHNVMMSLKQIYVVQDKLDKGKEMNTKMKAFDARSN